MAPPIAPDPLPPAVNPKVTSLKAIFPTVETVVIENILEAHYGDEEKAVGSLLRMTDETYVGDERPGADVLQSQSDYDASVARALALEDENHMHALRMQQRSQRPATQHPSEPIFDPSNIPYQPRVRKNKQGYQYQQGFNPSSSTQHHDNQAAGEQNYGYRSENQYHDQHAESIGLEEQFQKLATQGKQKFDGFMGSSFMKNVKDKVAYAGVTAQAKLASLPALASSVQNNAQSTEDHSTNQISGYNNNYRSPSEPHRPQTKNPDWPDEDWHVAPSTKIQINPATPLPTNAPLNDSGPFPSVSNGNLSSPLPSSTATRRSDEYIRNTGGRMSPSSGMLGTSPRSGVGISTSPVNNKIDFAKFGLLPKQKISLDGKPSPGVPSPSSSPIPASFVPDSRSAVRKLDEAALLNSTTEKDIKSTDKKHQEDSDDDLTYTRNPFDAND
ncbi:Ubiquitin system component Cue [Phaffia rhodozyma]|uniref:Ubiquitin system component Cue n=1 Tax=Phaffia rhodozyma TaxID=264483 RepID=A0A0F7SG39_PHARH|nr:Ubiquitin system component Cue [Phaffia rhodozyma]